MRKIVKLSFKGTDKEFNVNFKDPKYNINIEISKRNRVKRIATEN
jgi:hypothetical protein